MPDKRTKVSPGVARLLTDEHRQPVTPPVRQIVSETADIDAIVSDSYAAHSLERLAEIATSSHRTSVLEVVRSGLALTEAKKRCQHGEFGDWVMREAGISLRTAQNHMAAASAFLIRYEEARSKNEPFRISSANQIRSEVVTRNEPLRTTLTQSESPRTSLQYTTPSVRPEVVRLAQVESHPPEQQRETVQEYPDRVTDPAFHVTPGQPQWADFERHYFYWLEHEPARLRDFVIKHRPPDPVASQDWRWKQQPITKADQVKRKK